MKLSKTQQDIIDKLHNGWELGISTSIDGGCWIQQGGLGRGGISETVNRKTIQALVARGFIKYSEWGFPTRKLELVEG